MATNYRRETTQPTAFAVQGKTGEAEALFKRSQAMLEKVYNENHHHVAQPLINRARLLESQVGAGREHDFERE